MVWKGSMYETMDMSGSRLPCSGSGNAGTADASDAAEILIYAAYLGSGGTLSPQEYFG